MEWVGSYTHIPSNGCEKISLSCSRAFSCLLQRNLRLSETLRVKCEWHDFAEEIHRKLKHILFSKSMKCMQILKNTDEFN